MAINGAQETFTGCYSFTWFSLLCNFYWAGAWVYEYTKLCTVSNVSRIHSGFRFIVNPDPDPIIESTIIASNRRSEVTIYTRRPASADRTACAANFRQDL